MKRMILTGCVPAVLLVVTTWCHGGENMTFYKDLLQAQLEKPAPRDWRATGVTRELYCDLLERIVRRAADWVDERGAVIDPVIHREWAQTTPRFASSGAIALAFGRCSDLREKIFLAMDYSCRELTAPDIHRRSPDFWMRELATAMRVLRPVAPPERWEQWRAALAKVAPERHYTHVGPPEYRPTIHNWGVYASAGESLRDNLGIGGPAGELYGNAFFDAYMIHQLKKFNELGMYLDPGEPITYDITTRLQIAAALEGGYRGPLAAALDEKNQNADQILLLMVAPTGEVPFGGRSSLFHTVEGISCALFELSARRWKTENPRLAGAFKRQAHLSALAVKPWIMRDDGNLYHIKNYFAPETRHGCDQYGHYSVYSLYAASVFGLAALYADDSIPEAPAPAEIGGYGFAIAPTFNKAFANCAGNYLEFDLRCTPEQDANGLGRVLLKKMPWGLLPVLPFAGEPAYRLSPGMALKQTTAALAPEWQDAEGRLCRLAAPVEGQLAGVMEPQGLSDGNFTVRYEYGNCKVTYRADISVAGHLVLDCRVEGPAEDAFFVVPVLEFDGREKSEIRIADGALQVEYQKQHLKIHAAGAAPLAGEQVNNRAGSYRIFRFPMRGNEIQLRFELQP